MRQQNADLSGIELLILDEADRMMDMTCPTCAASSPRWRGAPDAALLATMPNEVVRDALESRATREVHPGRPAQPPGSITHRIEAVGAAEKPNWLIRTKQPEGPVLIFMRTRSAPIVSREAAAAGAIDRAA
jgi:superfamily II DNA/RNA helicase